MLTGEQVRRLRFMANLHSRAMPAAKSGAHRDFCLAKAHITTDQTVIALPEAMSASTSSIACC